MKTEYRKIVGRTLSKNKSNSPEIRIFSYTVKTETTKNDGIQGKIGIYKVPDNEAHLLKKRFPTDIDRF